MNFNLNKKTYTLPENSYELSYKKYVALMKAGEVNLAQQLEILANVPSSEVVSKNLSAEFGYLLARKIKDLVHNTNIRSNDAPKILNIRFLVAFLSDVKITYDMSESMLIEIRNLPENYSQIDLLNLYPKLIAIFMAGYDGGTLNEHTIEANEQYVWEHNAGDVIAYGNFFLKSLQKVTTGTLKNSKLGKLGFQIKKLWQDIKPYLKLLVVLDK